MAHRIETDAIRTGHRRTQEGEHSEPIFATSSFVFKSAAQAAARFSNQEPGNIYGRFTNPTVQTFERRLAKMEGAESCVATASGMGAISAVLFGLLQQGDQVLAADTLFGSTATLLEKYVRPFGVAVDFIPTTDLTAWAGAISDKTKLLIVESPTNPTTQLVDIRALAEIAHRHGALLVVDNAFCTPVLQRPIEMGADIVVHTATKYIDGQGRCLGGAVLGAAEILDDRIFGFLRSGGICMSPFNAWVFLKGLETLPLRMRAHCESAGVLANWLGQQPQVQAIYYPGLATHPQHALAQSQQSGFGGIVSFDMQGGQPAAWALIDSLKLCSITGNLGDTKSTITHPATTTHGRWSPEQRQAAGIGDQLVRISVGLEHIDDIIDDLSCALANIPTP